LPEHILYAVINLERPLFNAVTQSLNLDPQAVLQALETRLGRHFYGFNNRPIKMSESLRILLANALKQAHAERRRLLEASDLFIAIFKDRESFPVALLQKLGASRELVIEEIQNQVRGRDEPDSRTQPDQRGHRS
jgi:ATP-dependent Clp protease ATP-binding subunit ClpA